MTIKYLPELKQKPWNPAFNYKQTHISISLTVVNKETGLLFQIYNPYRLLLLTYFRTQERVLIAKLTSVFKFGKETIKLWRSYDVKSCDSACMWTSLGCQIAKVWCYEIAEKMSELLIKCMIQTVTKQCINILNHNHGNGSEIFLIDFYKWVLWFLSLLEWLLIPMACLWGLKFF